MCLYKVVQLSQKGGITPEKKQTQNAAQVDTLGKVYVKFR